MRLLSITTSHHYAATIDPTGESTASTFTCHRNDGCIIWRWETIALTEAPSRSLVAWRNCIALPSMCRARAVVDIASHSHTVHQTIRHNAVQSHTTKGLQEFLSVYFTLVNRMQPLALLSWANKLEMNVVAEKEAVEFIKVLL